MIARAFWFGLVEDDPQHTALCSERSVVGTAQNVYRSVPLLRDQYQSIGMTTENRGVGKSKKGRGVDNDEIESFLARGNNVLQSLCFQECYRVLGSVPAVMKNRPGTWDFFIAFFRSVTLPVSKSLSPGPSPARSKTN